MKEYESDDLKNQFSKKLDELQRALLIERQNALAAEADAISLDTIFNSTPLGMCITDDKGFFEKVNQAYCEFYGYKESELIGNHFTMIVPEQYRPLLSDMHDRFIDGSHEIRGEWDVQKRDGSIHTILGDACLIHGRDGKPRKVTFVMDISDRKRAEKLRTDIERITTHDLKSPLTSILTFPELLLETDGLTEDQKEMLSIIHDSGRQMLEMINRSQDVYRMEEGHYKVRHERFDVVSMLRRIETEQSALGRSRGIDLSISICGKETASTDSFKLWAEKLLVYSMLSNLIKNAYEATDESGHVSVNLLEWDGYSLIEVHNKAVVPAEIRDNFFSAFNTIGKTNGTGLGTYSAKLIAETHGGSIDVRSDAEHGTTITVRLPMRGE